MTQEARWPVLPGRNPAERLEAFLADYNLYQRCYLEQLYGEESSQNIAYLASFLTPLRLILWCPVCDERRPFGRVEGVPAPSHYQQVPRPGRGNDYPMDGEVFFIYLLCAGCSQTEFRCWVEACLGSDSPQSSVGWLRKVGQVPQWNIVLSQDLVGALGDDAELYKRAQICKTFSYGVGACAYLRRVLENQITPLLETVYALEREDGASDQELAEIQTIMQGRVAEEKIRLANKVLPESIKVPGRNALYDIYSRLSNGIHARDEQQCMTIANWASGKLEYVVTQLSAARMQRRERLTYVEGFDEFSEDNM